jgi:hypothetical protein
MNVVIAIRHIVLKSRITLYFSEKYIESGTEIPVRINDISREYFVKC